MHLVRSGLALALLVGVTTVAGAVTTRATADDTFTLRLATLAPRGSAALRLLDRWDRLLRQQTDGRLRLRVYGGGSAGDERSVIAKMRSNQLDAAAVSTTGLGMIARPALVLQAPGVIRTYAQLDAVREELAPELEAQFEASGFKLLGWGDAGKLRLFSRQRIERPRDLRAARVWAWRDNPIAGVVVRAAGANPVQLGVPEVYPALQTGMVDTVPASALVAVGLQWFTRVQYVTAQASGILVGAMILRKDKFDALPAELQQALTDSTAAHRDRIERMARQADERAYRAILNRGVTEVDMEPHRAEWEQLGDRARTQLEGRLFPTSLVQRVQAIASRHPDR